MVRGEMVRKGYEGIGREYERLVRGFEKEKGGFGEGVGKEGGVGR